MMTSSIKLTAVLALVLCAMVEVSVAGALRRDGRLPPPPPPPGGLKKPLHELRQEALKLFNENARLVPGFVQMIFHDCVGGCDGCVDTTNPANVGLVDKVEIAKEFRRLHLAGFSQADTNVFLGITALGHAASLAGGDLRIPFLVGRRDCRRDRPLPMREFPEGNSLHSLEFLKNAFGITEQEAIVLLGCHSIGQMTPANSGFHGSWDKTPQALDTEYFDNLRSEPWEHQIVDNNVIRSTQWTRDGTTMTHADMIVYQNFTISGDFDTPSCQFHVCEEPASGEIVDHYADSDISVFHADLARAFQKMVNKPGLDPY